MLINQTTVSMCLFMSAFESFHPKNWDKPNEYLRELKKKVPKKHTGTAHQPVRSVVSVLIA